MVQNYVVIFFIQFLRQHKSSKLFIHHLFSRKHYKLSSNCKILLKIFFFIGVFGKSSGEKHQENGEKQ